MKRWRKAEHEKFRPSGLAFLEIPFLIGAVTFAVLAISEGRNYWLAAAGCLAAAVLSWLFWPRLD